jgi:mutator protein MutT
MKPGIDFPGVSVGAMVLNDNFEVFLAKRGDNARNERGCWEIPGGRVEFGETLQTAIVREMKEEYNIEIELLEQLPAQNHLLPEEHQHWVPSCFISKIKSGTPQIMEPDKCTGIGWFPLTKLPTPLSKITKLDLVAFEHSNYFNNFARNFSIKIA